MWQAREEKTYTLEDIILLKVGRHLRPQAHYKMIIGREEGENNFLEGYRKKYPHIRITSHEGPLILIDGKPNPGDWDFIARIAARFSAGRKDAKVAIKIIDNNGSERELKVSPMPAEQIQQEWYI